MVPIIMTSVGPVAGRNEAPKTLPMIEASKGQKKRTIATPIASVMRQIRAARALLSIGPYVARYGRLAVPTALGKKRTNSQNSNATENRPADAGTLARKYM